MSNALQINGAQSDKQVKATPLYVGRNTTGLWTNRSPLRDAATGRISEKYYGPAGDAMIAGSNVEVTNRLTLSRRPGNPVYDSTNTYTDILSFDEFRYSKSLSDIWGTAIEQIDVMVDTKTALYADTNANTKSLVWSKTNGAGQDFMQEVGSELYFGNGIDQKKWLQSLFVRNTANDSSVLNTDAYPFMDTYLLDPNNNIQQLIGVQIAQVTAVSVTADVLTVTLSAPLGAGYDATPAGGDQAVGTYFTFWECTGAADVLNGNTLALTQQYTGGTTMVFAFVSTTNFTVSGMTAILQVANGVTSGITDAIGDVVITSIVTTGGSVPVWGTTVPSAANNFQGSITVDGNAVWVNRGNPVENWGIAAPTSAPTYTAQGTSVGWQANTYYSLGSIYQDNVSGYLWQISTPGLVGPTQPTWPASPTPQKKFDILSVAITSNVASFTTSAQTLTAGDIVTLQFLGPASFLNFSTSNLNLTVSATGLSTTTFQAAFTFGNYALLPDEGYGVENVLSPHPPTTQIDGAAVWVCIQTPASLAWAPGRHQFQNDYIQATPTAGTISYFQLQKNQQNNYPTPQPWLYSSTNPNDPVLEYYYHTDAPGNAKGAFNQYYPGAGSTFNSQVPSLLWSTGIPVNGSTIMNAYPVNGAGEQIGAGINVCGNNAGEWAITGTMFIPAPGLYTFSLLHDDGAFFSFDDQSANNFKVTGNFTETALITAHIQTAILGFGNAGGATQVNLCGNNNNTSANSPANTPFTDVATWSFANAGPVRFEIDYSNSQGNGGGGTPGQMIMTCNGYNIAIIPDNTKTLAGPPAWNIFTTVGATWNAARSEIVFGTADINHDGSQYTWVNIGPVVNFGWFASKNYTLPDTNIIDSNGNEEGPISTGYSGTTAPKWNTGGLNSLTLDNGSLVWINEGAIPIQPNQAGKITLTSAQGAIYAIALVNTLDNTVSNIGPVSASTGPLVNGTITFAPGAGLIKSAIDPQADYVAIFRTADGFTTELLIPGNGNTIYTIPLSTYLTYGYVDMTPDVGLDIQAPAPAAGENTPPLPGAINLAYHLNRLWYSIGNTVFWTSGPLDPIGNGINGFAPNNYDKMPSLVKRLVPTAIGMLVFTVSDVYKIPDDGAGNILPSVPYIPGVGLSSYNALDWNGPTIGFFTTDSQFLVLSPGVGGGVESVPIADQLSMRNGTPGQNWYPANVYVANYVSGQDMGWFLADGTNGWFRLISTPTPEPAGMIWSPFATLAETGGCGAIKSVETSPGVHHLLVGPRGSGVYILNRDVLSSTDGGTVVSTPATPQATYLGTAANFDILAGSAITGSAGAGSTVAGGNIGIYPSNATSITNFPPSVLESPGVFHYADASAILAQTDLTAAIVYYSGLPATLSGLGNLSTSGNGVNNHTYTAGVYKGSSSLDIPTSITLDAQGNSQAVFVFVAGSTITLESGASVILANGAQAGNVYWVCGSAFTSVWNGIQSNMVGTIMAYSGITLGGGNLNGRALATTAGFVTMSTTETITFPTLTSVPGTGIVGTPYPAYAVFGSYVLAQPGQVANIQFITLKSVLTGSPAILGLLLDDGLPYYKGSFEILKKWVNDPPELKPSRTWYSQRFYLSDMPTESAAVTDLQIMVQWPAEAAINELQTFTIFGSYTQEQ